MSTWEKAVNALFLAVNSQHTGESTVDLSTHAPTILVLFVLIMYLPPYTTWFPFEENSITKEHLAESHGIRLLKSIVLSQLKSILGYLCHCHLRHQENKAQRRSPQLQCAQALSSKSSGTFLLLLHSSLSILIARSWQIKRNTRIADQHGRSSPLPSLAIFTIMACITARKSTSADPLNFSIFSVVFEVISAYGNVGYSLGYSCDKLLKPDATCKDARMGSSAGGPTKVG